MKNSRFPWWLLASIVLTAVLSLYGIFQRYRVEARNKAVAIAAEYESIEALAAAEGRSMPDAISSLKSHGLNAIVLSEQTVGDLENGGKVEFKPVPGGSGMAPVSMNRDVTARLRRAFAIRLGQNPGAGGEVRLPPNPSTALLRSTSVGLDPEQSALARVARLMIIGRFANPAGISSTGVRETLAWGRDMGVRIYLPMGEQVLGRRDSVGTTIEALRSLGILYATPEFTRIGGDANIVSEAPNQVVRLHSAQVGELDKMPLVDCVDRYGRAARERNMRVLLLRPVSFGADKPLATFGEFIKLVGERVRDEGGEVGEPHPFAQPDLPRWWPVLVALAALPTIFFAAAAFVSDKRVQTVGAALLLVAALAAYTKTGSQVGAFLISLAFPFAGYVLLDRLRPRNVVAAFALVSVLSFVGGLGVAGMLNGLTYYVQADEFRGVKLSVFFPIVLVGGYFFTRLVDWKGTMRSPITWGTAALGLILLLALAVVIARTGNDTGVGASDTELIFRSLLDRFLYVRPRTKEFMVGHPLLMVGCGMLGVYYGLRDRLASEKDSDAVRAVGAWTTMILMVSAVGQTSIVNTMSHIHIPVLLSLVRVLEGLVIGCIIGLALWAVVSRMAVGKVE